MNINVTIDTGVPEVDDYLARQLRGVVERAVTPQLLVPEPELRFGSGIAQASGTVRNFREQEYTTHPARIRELIDEAMRMRAPVDITYEDVNGVFTRRDFSPSRVRPGASPTGKRVYYAQGYCQAREEPRSFRLDRIKALEVR